MILLEVSKLDVEWFPMELNSFEGVTFGIVEAEDIVSSGQGQDSFI